MHNKGANAGGLSGPDELFLWTLVLTQRRPGRPGEVLPDHTLVSPQRYHVPVVNSHGGAVSRNRN